MKVAIPLLKLLLFAASLLLLTLCVWFVHFCAKTSEDHYTLAINTQQYEKTLLAQLGDDVMIPVNDANGLSCGPIKRNEIHHGEN